MTILKSYLEVFMSFAMAIFGQMKVAFFKAQAFVMAKVADFRAQPAAKKTRRPAKARATLTVVKARRPAKPRKKSAASSKLA